jgi:hypothetical protein
MKKIVGTIAAIALATSAVFADVNVGMGFNRGVFTPFAMVKDGEADAEFYMGNSASWGWGGPRIGVSFSAGSEDIGVAADVKFDGGQVNVNDNAYIWVKPFSFLTLKLGQTFDDTLRSGAAYGSWDLFRASRSIRGDDAIFKRVGAIGADAGKDESSPLVGAIIMLDPMEALHISIGLPIDYAYSNYDDVFPAMQIAAGYTIDGVGQIKAQYIGNGVTADPKGLINAAFCLDAVENMDLDIGFFMGTWEKSDIVITAFWGMPFDALKLNANLEVILPGQDDDKMTLTAGVGVGYDLGNGLNVGADFRFTKKFYDNEPTVASQKAAMEIGAWVGKGLASGSITVGLQYFMNEGANGMFPCTYTGETASTFAVPVMFQCFF